MKAIRFGGITNPMSNNEMKLVRAGEAIQLGSETEASDVAASEVDCGSKYAYCYHNYWKCGNQNGQCYSDYCKSTSCY